MSHRVVAAILALYAMALVGTANAGEFRLSSTTFAANATLSLDQVFNGFGCTGKNRSPALHWSGAPAGTRSFALTVFDPDAPTGSGFWHWVLYNLPAGTTELAAGAGAADGERLPHGAVQGRTDFGTRGYSGPCPPPGDKPHRYRFTLYALKSESIDVPTDSTAALVGFAIHGLELGHAQLSARYGR